MYGNRAYAEEDASSGSGGETNTLDGNSKHPAAGPQSARLKRSRRKATGGDAIVDAMLEIAAASKARVAAMRIGDDRFAISKCIKMLDEMEGVDQALYFYALDLFESPTARETFVSLKSERRLVWMRRKFSRAASGGPVG